MLCLIHFFSSLLLLFSLLSHSALAQTKIKEADWDYLFTDAYNGFVVPYHAKFKKDLLKQLKKDPEFIRILQKEIADPKSKYAIFKSLPEMGDQHYYGDRHERLMKKLKKTPAQAGEYVFKLLYQKLMKVEELDLGALSIPDLQLLYTQYFFYSEAIADPDQTLNPLPTLKIPVEISTKLHQYALTLFHSKPESFFDLLQHSTPTRHPERSLTGANGSFESWFIHHFITWEEMKHYLLSLSVIKRWVLLEQFPDSIKEAYLTEILETPEKFIDDWVFYAVSSGQSYFKNQKNDLSHTDENGNTVTVSVLLDIEGWLNQCPELKRFSLKLKQCTVESKKAFMAGIDPLSKDIKLFFKNMMQGMDFEDAVAIAENHYEISEKYKQTEDFESVFKQNPRMTLSNFMKYYTKNWSNLNYQDEFHSLGFFFKDQVETKLNQLSEPYLGSKESTSLDDEEEDSAEGDSDEDRLSQPIGIVAYHQYIKLHPLQAHIYDRLYFEKEFFPSFFEVSSEFFDPLFQSSLLHSEVTQFWDVQGDLFDLKNVPFVFYTQSDESIIASELDRAFQLNPELKNRFLEYALYQRHEPHDQGFQRQLVLKYATTETPAHDRAVLEQKLFKPEDAEIIIKNNSLYHIRETEQEPTELYRVKELYDSDADFHAASNRFFKWLLQNPHEFVYHFAENRWLQGLLLHIPIDHLPLNKEETASLHRIFHYILTPEDYFYNLILDFSDVNVDRVYTFLKLHLKIIQIEMQSKKLTFAELDALRERHEALIEKIDLDGEEHHRFMNESQWNLNPNDRLNRDMQNCAIALHEKLVEPFQNGKLNHLNKDTLLNPSLVPSRN